MKKIEIILKKQNDKKEIYEEIVEYNEDISSLNLSFKSLIEIPKGLEQFKNLEILYLHDNQISKIENLDNNINLTTLNLYNNKITKIENLDNLINLTYLNLSKNQITKIKNIHHLEKLEYFRLFDEDQNENIEESKQISLSNKEIELKEIQIQKEIKEELLKQENNRKLEKEYFDNNFDKIKQQFIKSNHQNNDLLI